MATAKELMAQYKGNRSTILALQIEALRTGAGSET
jgi:hypothetical protein